MADLLVPQVRLLFLWLHLHELLHKREGQTLAGSDLSGAAGRQPVTFRWGKSSKQLGRRQSEGRP